MISEILALHLSKTQWPNLQNIFLCFKIIIQLSIRSVQAVLLNLYERIGAIYVTFIYVYLRRSRGMYADIH